MEHLLAAIFCVTSFVAAQVPDCESFYPLRVGDTLIYECKSGSISQEPGISLQLITIDSCFNVGDTTCYLRRVIALDTLGDTLSRGHDTLLFYNGIVFGHGASGERYIEGFSSMKCVLMIDSIRQACVAEYDSICDGYANYLYSITDYLGADDNKVSYKQIALPRMTTRQVHSYTFDSCLVFEGRYNPVGLYETFFARGVGLIFRHWFISQYSNSTELLYSNSPCLQRALGTTEKSIKPLRRRSFKNPEMFDLAGRRIKGTSIAAGNGIVIMRSNGVATTQIRMGSGSNRWNMDFH